MLIELRPVDSIKPYDQNPRRNDGAVDAMARSITDFGFRQPVVVDDDGVIIVGHTRWKGARQLGLTEVPVHVARAGQGIPDSRQRHSADLHVGSQLIAAEQTGRRCYAMELERFVEVAVRRWEKFTGKQAGRLAGPGVSAH